MNLDVERYPLIFDIVRLDPIYLTRSQASSRAALAFLVSAALLPQPVPAQQPPPPVPLRIEVLEGEGAINNVRLRRAKEPVVRVTDDDKKPIVGASVVFLMPDMGPSGEFSAGVRSLTLVTDDSGQAAGRGLVANQLVGKFQIRVVASYRGQMATAFINQTNAEPAAATSSGPSKKYLIIALIGGAAAGGIALAARGHGSSPSTALNPPPTGAGIVITPGNPVIQPPQ